VDTTTSPASGQARELEIGRDPAGDTDFGDYVMQALRAAEGGQRIRVTRHGQVIARIEPPAPLPDDSDLLIATVKAGSLPGLRKAAMADARELYGEQAELRIEHSGPVYSYRSAGHYGSLEGIGELRFRAEVVIRCLNYPSEAALP
jgi:antitoxin (DNA-binding transcriptional repressor) of toxin-antitoxin stability system